MEKQIIKKIIINYLKFLSHIKLKWKFKGQIISLGGCYGKSSAVNLLESVFKNEYKIYTSSQSGKGLNSETGIPFVILNIKPTGYSIFHWIKYLIQAITGLFKKFEYNLLILELGVDKPNDLKFLTSLITSNLGLIINSNNSHSQNFESLQKTTKRSFEDLIAYENGYIFETSKDAILYNLDDPEVIKQINRFKGDKKIPFSLKNNPQISEFKPTLKGTFIKFKYNNKELEINYPEPLLEEYRNTIEMMLKAAEYYNLKPESVIRGLSDFKLPPSRCSLFRGIKDSFIIDSSYNSSYLPTSSAIKLLTQTTNYRPQTTVYRLQSIDHRKLALLGDMRELGVLSEKEHQKLALIAAENLDIVITVGPLMKQFFYPEFIKVKKDSQIIYSFESTKETLNFLSKDNFKFIKKNDLILIKGSQNTLLLETVVEALLKDKKDANRLCRRGEYWDKERRRIKN